jgi:hypothetical protein
MLNRLLVAAASLLIGTYSLAYAQSSTPSGSAGRSGAPASPGPSTPGPSTSGPSTSGTSEAGTKDITPGSGTSSTLTVNPPEAGASQSSEKARSATGGPDKQGPTAGPAQPNK